MDAMLTILTRRSIRQFTRQPVADVLLEKVLCAAMSAPSAGNQQPWQFVVIRSRVKMDTIPLFHPFADMLKTAALAVLVCGDMQRTRMDDFWVQDCSAATLNLLLAAHASGLGAVWVGVYPTTDRVERFRKLLGIPASIIPFSLVPMGYPAEKIAPVNRYDPNRVHKDQW